MIPMSSADEKYISTLKTILQTSWAGVIILGGVAGFLLNALSGSDVPDDIRKLLVHAVKADMLIVLLLAVFTFFLFFLFTGIGLYQDGKKGISYVSDAAALAFFGGVFVVFFLLVEEVKVMWAILVSLQ